jgi:hypothetical protein
VVLCLAALDYYTLITLYNIVINSLFGSTFGNILEPTSNSVEVIFSIINVLSGLMLFTLLIGNIQVKSYPKLFCSDYELYGLS